MKSKVMLLCAAFSLILFSCSKEKNNYGQATEVPPELSYMKGNWKVVDFYVDNGWGAPDSNPQPDFDAMTLSQQRVVLYDQHQKKYDGPFRFAKEEKSGVWRFTLLNHPLLLDFYVVPGQNDTLGLSFVGNDFGTSYTLVRTP